MVEMHVVRLNVYDPGRVGPSQMLLSYLGFGVVGFAAARRRRSSTARPRLPQPTKAMAMLHSAPNMLLQQCCPDWTGSRAIEEN